MYYYVPFRNGRNGYVLSYLLCESFILEKRAFPTIATFIPPISTTEGQGFNVEPSPSRTGASPGRSLVSLNSKAGSVPGHLLLDFGTTWTCGDAKTEIFKE